MATQQADKAEMEDQAHQRHQPEAGDEVIAIDLPAPEGWTKKFYPNRGGTPGRNEIIFISPTGEEIKNKKQLDQYRRSHPGSPPPSEFDWGTGDTPRRSARLSGKAKAREIQTPQSGSSQKRQKKSSSKKTAKEENAGIDEEGEAHQDEEMVSTEAAEKPEDTIEVKMKDAEVDTKAEETEDAPVDKDDRKKAEQKTQEKADDAAEEKPEHADGENLPEKEELRENNGGEALDKADGKEADSEKLPIQKEEHPDENKAEAQEKPADTLKQKEVPKERDESGDIGMETNGAKENQEAAKCTENHPVSREEAAHEPNAPPISCGN